MVGKQIANQFNISDSTVYQAIKILKEAPLEILNDVRAGILSIHEAHKEITKMNSESLFNNKKSKIEKIKNNIFWAHIKITSLKELIIDEKQYVLIKAAESYLAEAENELYRML